MNTTNKEFGWFFSALSVALVLISYWKSWDSALIVAIAFSIFFIVVTLLFPQILTPLKRIWYHLGELLGRIVSPIVLGIIFFVLMTPIALFARSLGRDELKINRRNLESYWVDRSPPGPAPDSFKNQY